MRYLNSYNRKVEVLDESVGGIPNLHYGKMKRICMLKPAQIAQEYGLTEYKTKNGKKFWFKDNGSRVLGIAHVDTVKPFRHFRPVKFAEDTKIFTQTLDDRLGLHIMLDYLTQAKIKVDILMTTDEEQMQSTGLYFGPPKDYNWMFMFDRAGTGAVTYAYGDEQLRYKLNKHNFDVDRGSYSCIADMEHLKCKGINFGVGYHDNHGEYAWASRKELYSQLRKFVGFFREYETTRMPHDPGLGKFTSKYWRNYYENKEELNGQYSIVATQEEVRTIERAREKRETQELLGGVLNKDCGCEICMSGISCQDFPALQGPPTKSGIKPSEDIAAGVRDKTIYLTDDDGNITGIAEERIVFRLYEPITILQLDTAVQNILRSQFKCLKVWDLCNKSPYALMKGGYLTAPDIDSIDLALQDLGFGIPWNLAGFRNPEDEEVRVAFGYKRRAKAIKSDKKPLPKEFPAIEYKERMGVFQTEEFANRTYKERALDKKTIDMFPTAAFDIHKMVAKARELTASGYNVRMHAECIGCNKHFQWDFTKTELAPERCETCSHDESQLSLFTFVESTDHIPDEGADVLGLMQLRKDLTDDTQFTFIGKEAGRGIDKFGWVSPIKQYEEIGFTFA